MDHDEFMYYECGEECHTQEKENCNICKRREGKDFTLTSYDNRPIEKKPFWKLW